LTITTESEEDSNLSITNPTEDLTLKSVESKEEDLYWEKDDVNPNQVIYDLENDKIIIPTSEEEIIPTLPEPIAPKFLVKNVGNTRYRNNR
jgi:hypothetical protein